MGKQDLLNPSNQRRKPTLGLSAILRSPQDVVKVDTLELGENINETNRKPRPEKPKKQVEKIDRRKKEDKKVTFTNSMRGSLLEEIHETIKSYRKNIDVDYNLAKFLEDASIEQMKVLKQKIS